MTLRNAFEDLAVESTQQSILTAITTAAAEAATTAAIDAVGLLMQRQNSISPTRALQYARTASDQMRVNVENQAPVIVYQGNSSTSQNGAALQMGLWSTGSWNIVDQRYIQGESQFQSWQATRHNRWVIT